MKQQKIYTGPIFGTIIKRTKDKIYKSYYSTVNVPTYPSKLGKIEIKFTKLTLR